MGPDQEVMNTDKSYLCVPTHPYWRWVQLDYFQFLTPDVSCHQWRHLKGTTVAPAAPAVDMGQPNRWRKDKKKAYGGYHAALAKWEQRSEEHTSELQSLRHL